MEILLSPDIVVQIIQVVGAIMVAVITYWVGPVVVERLQRERKPEPVQPHRLRYALAGGAAAAVTFVVIGLLFTLLTPKPSIAITNPIGDRNIDIRSAQTGSGSFSVSG